MMHLCMPPWHTGLSQLPPSTGSPRGGEGGTLVSGGEAFVRSMVESVYCCVAFLRLQFD